ncbi:hypothetical protein Tco_0694465, partial [Tanacetum coccineum]
MKARLDQALVYKMKARLDQTLVMLQSPNLSQVMLFMLDQTLNIWTSRSLMLQLQPIPSKWNNKKLDIPHKVSQAVDEIVTNAVDWAIQAPLRARFRDLPIVDMKELLQHRMFEDDSYKANNEKARKKRRKRRDAPRSPLGSPPSQPPHLPPLAGASGAPVPSSSKTTTSTQQSMAWTTFNTRYESTGIVGAQELCPSDDLMHDDFAPDEQVQVSDDQDSENDH